MKYYFAFPMVSIVIIGQVSAFTVLRRPIIFGYLRHYDVDSWVWIKILFVKDGFSYMVKVNDEEYQTYV